MVLHSVLKLVLYRTMDAYIPPPRKPRIITKPALACGEWIAVSALPTSEGTQWPDILHLALLTWFPQELHCSYMAPPIRPPLISPGIVTWEWVEPMSVFPEWVIGRGTEKEPRHSLLERQKLSAPCFHPCGNIINDKRHSCTWNTHKGHFLVVIS